MTDVLVSYIKHEESKMDDSIGILERKHPNIEGFIYIDKEASNLEKAGILDILRYATYADKEDLLKRIKSMSFEEAKKLGIPKTTYYRLRKTLGKWKEVRLKRKTKGRLVK